MKNKKKSIVIIFIIVIAIILITITSLILIKINNNDTTGNEQLGVQQKEQELTLVQMYKNGENCVNINCTDATHLHSGDYVEGYFPENPNAVVEVGREETGYDGENQVYAVEDLNWRDLGLSEDGNHVLLISGNPIKKVSTGNETSPYLTFRGAESYVYGEDTLNKICNIYINSELADEARSINIDDINRTLGVVVETGIDVYGYGYGKVYREYDAEKIDISDFNIFGYQPYIYKEGDYAPENYVIDSANAEGRIIEVLTAKKIGDTNNPTSYSYFYSNANIDVPTTIQGESNKRLSINNKVYNMLFEGTEEEEEYAKSYWLASTGIYVSDDYASFGLGCVSSGLVTNGGEGSFSSLGTYTNPSLSVRPVISLKSYITNSRIKKSENQNIIEEDWTVYAYNLENQEYMFMQGEEGRIK